MRRNQRVAREQKQGQTDDDDKHDEHARFHDGLLFLEAVEGKSNCQAKNARGWFV